MGCFSEELADYLVSEGVGTATGTDVFYNYLPDVTASPTVAIKENNGIPNHEQAIPTFVVQILVRANDYDTARVTAAEIYNLLEGGLGISLTNYRIISGLAVQFPASVGEDSANRNLVSFNMEFAVHGTGDGGGTSGDKDPTEIAMG